MSVAMSAATASAENTTTAQSALQPAAPPQPIPQTPRRLYADSDYSFRKPIPPPKPPKSPKQPKQPRIRDKTARGALATWDPPPLFQSYPQAIKHAQLPTCTTSIDTLLRSQGSHEGTDKSKLARRDSTSTEGTGSIAERADKIKRRHRGNTSSSLMKLDWASKIYVLVTSGHLLQYSAEGSFDRLPEKILPISKDSAAFASDLIPGRHWVLRVCSSTKTSGSQSGDARSILSRFPFRSTERRDASAILMVFESAEDMESWITTLRREIEHLGGKKKQPETGTLTPEDVEAATSEQTIQLTTEQKPTVRELHIRDDVSTTNSVYSQDGRQLDNLRDSSNRYSYISSGQRTVFTSDTGSSPPCSPARDSFASSPSEEQLPSRNDIKQQSPPVLQQRQSYPDFDCCATFPFSTPPLSTSPAMPNFSVPHSSKRFSGVLKPPSPDTVRASRLPIQNPGTEPTSYMQHLQRLQQDQQQQYHQPQAPQERQLPFNSSSPRSPQVKKQQQLYPPPQITARNNARKLPPPALAYSRPLSVVPDQPSPATASPPLSREKSSASIDDGNASSVDYSPETFEAPCVPWASSERASTSSQRSGSSGGVPKPWGSFRDKLTRGSSGSSTTTSSSEKTPRKHSRLLTLRKSLSKISSVVMSDITPFGVPYSAALALPISQIPVQYRSLPKGTSVAEEGQQKEDAETPNDIQDVDRRAKTYDIDSATPEIHTVEGIAYHQSQEDGVREEVLLPDLPQLPQRYPMPLFPQHQHVQQHSPRETRDSVSRQGSRSPMTAGYLQGPAELGHGHAAVQRKHSQPWDDMGVPVHRSPFYHLSYRPASPASVMTSFIDPGSPASRPITPRAPSRNGHSMPRRSSRASDYRQRKPEVIDGPPPAPPPTCALPPLPPLSSKGPKVDDQRLTLQA